MADDRMVFAQKLLADDPHLSDDDLAAALKIYDAHKQAGPDKVRTWSDTAREVGVGILKGAGSTIAGIGDAMANAGMIPGAQPAAFNPVLKHPLLTRADAATTATNTPQMVGKGLETAAEVAMPVYEGGKLLISAAKAAPELTKAALQTGSEMLTSEQPLITQLRTRVARKVFGHVLDTYGPSAAAEASTTPSVAGTKLVKPPTLEEALAQALEETRAELNAPTQPAKITTPPQPNLPPGYQPRTAAPKVVAPKTAAAPAQMPQAAPASATVAPSTPTRPYFLKSPEQMAEEASYRSAAPAAKPLGGISIADLPESWKGRTTQDIIPTQGALGKEVIKAFTQELKDRGLSINDAVMAVSKDKSLPTAVRAQLLQALSRSAGQ